MGVSNNQHIYDKRVVEHFEGKGTLSTAHTLTTAIGRQFEVINTAVLAGQVDKVATLAQSALTKLKQHYEDAKLGAGSELEGLYLTHHYLDATAKVRNVISQAESHAKPSGWFGTAAKMCNVAIQASGMGSGDAVKKFEDETKAQFKEALQNVKQGLVLTPQRGQAALSSAEKVGLRKLVTHMEVGNIGAGALTGKIVGALVGFMTPEKLTGTTTLHQLVQQKTDSGTGILGQIFGKIGESYRKDFGDNIARAFLQNPNNVNYLSGDLTSAVSKLVSVLYESTSLSGVNAEEILSRVCPGETGVAAQARLAKEIAGNLSKILVPEEQSKENRTPPSSPQLSPKTGKANILQTLGNKVASKVTGVVQSAAGHVKGMKGDVKREVYNSLAEVAVPKLVAMLANTIAESLPLTLSKTTKETVLPLLVATMLAEVTESLAFYINNPQSTGNKVSPSELNNQVGTLVNGWVMWAAVNGSRS